MLILRKFFDFLKFTEIKMRLTQEDYNRLAEEMQEIIMSIFNKETGKIARMHTEAEQQRLEEIAKILKEYEIVDSSL
jgi:DNA-binding MurR/RpiR family transcriptional regulator